MIKRRAVRGVLAVLACGVTMIGNGCGAARPAKYYQLTVPGDMSANDPNALPVTLLLGPLTASHLYREDRIVYSSAGQNMGTYEYQRWAEPPTEMIQDVLFRQLRASGRYRTVNSLRSNARGDFWRLSMSCWMQRRGLRCGRITTRMMSRWKGRK